MRFHFISAALVLLASAPAFAQAPGEPSAVVDTGCDHACLVGFARDYMRALAARDPSQAHLAPHVRFTENNVELAIGKEGLWSTITAVPATGLEAADPTTGEAAWIGAVEEHGLPVYYGMRLKVRERAVTEVETVVVRRTGLPLPFGDVSKLVHDPSFAEVLPEEERRPRERLIAVANAYFSTVELNDGTVFAPFDEDCARIENGIYTTRGGTGSSGDIAQGCEQQFKLGIYRINKRVRERRYPLVDVERGVVVATGFFDHANEFDTYKTTDGKERKTLLKWPNSISLVEAFKIRNGRIYRIEAIFTYVPYFMHSPFYAYPTAHAAGSSERDATAQPCDAGCLDGLAERYMEALVHRDPAGLPWAKRVKYTENGVPMMIGEGIWGSARSKGPNALKIADPETGDVVWYGVVYEHDAPAYYAMRLRARDGRIAEVEAWVARARNPGPFGDPSKFKVDPSFTTPIAAAARQPRARLIALADGYANTMQLNDGKLFVPFVPGCSRIENGEDVSNGKGASAVVDPAAAARALGCKEQLALGVYKPIDRIRGRRIAAVDAERGLVAMTSLADFGLADVRYYTTDGKARQTSATYPSTRELLEIFKLRDGKIERVEAVSVFQPYGMLSAWTRR
ncbi:MAG TPA: hypothetical protein VFS52_21660 [Steroidobacteraceae bacterium]|jgi:hypothetical protein|nr:hypothetical protein [Steroidobacteraceae bacterium]